MTLLPFQPGDIVLWDGRLVVVVEVRGERVVVSEEDGLIRITTQEFLRGHQMVRPPVPPARGAA